MRWIRFFERPEVWIRRIAILGILSLLVVQFFEPQVTRTFLQSFVYTSANSKQSNEVSSAIQSSSKQTTMVDLELSDANLQAQRVTVKVNGKTEAQFTGPNMSVSLHQDDIVTIQTSGVQTAIHVTVDHNDPNLLYPAPGYTISVDDSHPYTFEKVEFFPG